MKTKGYKTALFLSAILVISAIAPIAIADDTEAPTIEFIIPPTPANNSEISVGYVNVTVNVTDPVSGSGLIDCVELSVWNETGQFLNVWNETGQCWESFDHKMMWAFEKHKFYYYVSSYDTSLSQYVALPNGNYTYKVYAKDTATPANIGVSETRSVTINKTEGASFDLELGAGWNLISIPLEIDNTSINAVFSNANDGDELYAYVNNTWKPATFYAGYGWDGDFETVEPDKGYWYSATTSYTATIKGTEAGTRDVSIAEGWNLIGYTRLSDANLSEVLPNVTNEDELYAYNGEWIPATYYSGYGWDGELSKMEPGKGYWYSANAPFIWEY